MEPFRTLEGVACPLPLSNVDTDQVIPARFLKEPRAAGHERFLFHDLRFDRAGKATGALALDHPERRGAVILVARRNFGAGSSREAAVYALLDFGIRCVIAPSFADIFYNNCFKNGILPITLPQEDVDKLMDDANRGANAVVSIDLEKQEIRGPDGGCVKFEIDAFRKHCLLNGLDDIGLTMQKAANIDTYEQKARVGQPWLW
jgi:3-isopropylmalate/(R)-2-methylmalate dehydratase small subunit